MCTEFAHLYFRFCFHGIVLEVANEGGSAFVSH